MLTRLAKHYQHWAEVYGDRNREGGNLDYAERCKESARRHFISRQEGKQEEDHASALVWNIRAYEYLKEKNTRTDSWI